MTDPYQAQAQYLELAVSGGAGNVAPGGAEKATCVDAYIEGATIAHFNHPNGGAAYEAKVRDAADAAAFCQQHHSEYERQLMDLGYSKEDIPAPNGSPTPLPDNVPGS